MRMIDAAEFFRAGMNVNERLLGARNIDQRIALARHFTQPSADQEQHIGILDARDDFRIGSDTEIAAVARMRLVEEMPAAERIDHRQFEAFGETLHGGAGFFRPAAAADDRDRLFRAPQ